MRLTCLVALTAFAVAMGATTEAAARIEVTKAGSPITLEAAREAFTRHGFALLPSIGGPPTAIPPAFDEVVSPNEQPGGFPQAWLEVYANVYRAKRSIASMGFIPPNTYRVQNVVLGLDLGATPTVRKRLLAALGGLGTPLLVR